MTDFPAFLLEHIRTDDPRPMAGIVADLQCMQRSTDVELPADLASAVPRAIEELERQGRLKWEAEGWVWVRPKPQLGLFTGLDEAA